MKKSLAAFFALVLLALATPCGAWTHGNNNNVNTLPAGVSLRAIDGGPTYYTSNGFTAAANAGWDSPTFIPVGLWESGLTTQAQANQWKAAGLNTAFFTGGITTSLLVSNGIAYVGDQQGATTLDATSAAMLAANQLMWNETFDEPGSYAVGASTPIGGLANASQDAQPWYVNLTWTHIFAVVWNQPSFNAFLTGGGFSGSGLAQTRAALSQLITTPGGRQRHIDIQSIDEYYFAGTSPSANWLNCPGGSCTFFGGSPYQAGEIYTNSGTPTAPGYTLDLTQRAVYYGDDIDTERNANPNSAPMCAFVEDGQPYTSTGFQYYITPPQMNAAVWSALIHGALCIIYFDHNFDQTKTINVNLYDTYFNTVQSSLTNWGPLGGPAESVSIVAQMTATNAAVAAFAPVLKAPFAMGYATVSPAGWLFGQSAQQGTATSKTTGFDLAVHYYNGHFYLLSQSRDSQTNVNQTPTFTIQEPSGTIFVCGEGRSFSFSGGTFTDTFADGNAVHRYGVNASC